MSKLPGFLFDRDEWHRVGPFVVDPDGKFRLDKSLVHESSSQYQPFDYYYGPVPKDIVRDILPSASLGAQGKDFFLHTLFASMDVDNQGQMLRFINHFGLPLSADRNTVTRLDNEKHEVFTGLVPLADGYSDILWFYRWAADLAALYGAARRDQLVCVLRSGFAEIRARDLGSTYPIKALFDQKFQMQPEAVKTEQQIEWRPFRAATTVIVWVLRPHLVGVHPFIEFGTREERGRQRDAGTLGKVPLSPGFSWEFSDRKSVV